MRSLILITLLVTSSLFSKTASADPEVHLRCERSSGGPEAQVEVILNLQNFEIKTQLVNENYPEGIVGNYTGSLTESGYIFAHGTIDGSESHLGLSPTKEGYVLTLYARGDSGNTSIEFGFGLHSICK